MNSLPAFLSIALTVAFLWTVVAIMVRRRNRRAVEDGPDGEPYRVYTREFDRTLMAADLPTGLYEASPDREKGHLERGDWQWRSQIADAEHIYAALGDTSPLDEHQAGELNDTAILLMIDQSGSMRDGPMTWVSAGVRRLSEDLGRRGASVAVAGYTTAGWHGGFARREWMQQGRPKRPGRLCVLLHLLYQPFDSAGLDENGWRQMLNPDILRENVDGEALQWGAEYLKERPERRRILLIVSDGAPVDDSTLLANGPSYLHRHLLKVRDALIGANTLELMAIGVGHRIADYYPVSREALDAAGLAQAGLELVRGQ